MIKALLTSMLTMTIIYSLAFVAYAEEQKVPDYPVNIISMANQIGVHDSFKIYESADLESTDQSVKEITISTNTDSVLSKKIIPEEKRLVNPKIEYEYHNGVVNSGTITYSFEKKTPRNPEEYLSHVVSNYANALLIFKRAKFDLIEAGYTDVSVEDEARFKKGDVLVKMNALMNTWYLFIKIEAIYDPIKNTTK